MENDYIEYLIAVLFAVLLGIFIFKVGDCVRAADMSRGRIDCAKTDRSAADCIKMFPEEKD